MSNTILIEAGPLETRVAVLEQGRLVEVQLERAATTALVGNIYRGRVARVVPGIEAAFVDIGLSRDAFLFAGDLPRPTIEKTEGERAPAGGRPEPPAIERVLKQGDELLVQVVKEPRDEKSPRISSQLSLPGRFLVLLPGGDEVGISRRIEAEESRSDLERILRELKPEGAGLIGRTAAEGRSRRELELDLEALGEQWRSLVERAAGATAPAVIATERPLALRTLRDLADQDLEVVHVEGRQAFEELVRYVEQIEPALVDRLSLYDQQPALFDRFKIDRDIGRALQRRVWLRSGGFIAIDPTEALVAIDVNSGRSTEQSELEETALKTNLEAAQEIGREVRLRDLAGIIVVDFIDMLEPDHRHQVVAGLQSALAGDRSRSQIAEMSDFGLVAITRKRTRGTLAEQMTERCPCCAGAGRVKDPMTIGLEVDRELQRRSTPGDAEIVRVRLHPWVKAALVKRHHDLWKRLGEHAGGRVELVTDAELDRDRFEISTKQASRG